MKHPSTMMANLMMFTGSDSKETVKLVIIIDEN